MDNKSKSNSCLSSQRFTKTDVKLQEQLSSQDEIQQVKSAYKIFHIPTVVGN